MGMKERSRSVENPRPPATFETLRPLVLFPPVNNQKFEDAVRTLPKQALGVRASDGLYSTLGRADVGLTEADINNLTATITGRAEVLESAKRAAVAKSMFSLLEPKREKPHPTINPPCFRGSADTDIARETSASVTEGKKKTRALTSGSSPTRKSPARGRSPEGRSGFGVSSQDLGVKYSVRRAVRCTGQSSMDVFDRVGLEDSGRVRVFGADESEHRKKMNSTVRRLRGLLDESLDDAESSAKRPGSPSLLSVSELRALASAKRPRGNVRDEEVGGMVEGTL